MSIERVFNGKAPQLNFPAPYQDEEGRWWFYDPETGYTNDEVTKAHIKRMFPNLPEPKLEGRLIMRGTNMEDAHHGSFKDLWDSLL